MTVTYLHHSGFLVETSHSVLLFDYYTEHGKYDKLVPADYMGKDFYVFVSHAHGDHFDSSILRWADQVQYIFSDDVQIPKDFTGKVTWVKPHTQVHVGNIEVSTLQSNDEGVAFLVKVDGKCIFHAGDLNWWHWNGEPQAFLDDIKQSYCGEIDRLRGEQIDVAFVPADPRLQDKYDWAVQYFMDTVGAKTVFPMHFWRRFELCEALRQKPYGAHIAVITREGEAFSV